MRPGARPAARRALVLYGETGRADPDEADTLAQVAVVRAMLAELGYAVTARPVGLDLRPLAALGERPPGLIFNLVEAISGDGSLIHLVPAVLESLRLPFTGASAAAIYATSNKPLAKRLLRAAGIATPAWLEPERAGAEPPDPAQRYIIKSVWEHASLGLDAGSVVPGAGVSGALAARHARFGGEWFAERYVEGREFNLSLLEGPAGPEVLPVAETLFLDFPEQRPRIVDYEAKWLTDSFAYSHTPRRFLPVGQEAALRAALEALARECWRLFGLRGYARVDFRVDEAGTPWVLEVNANPCLSPDAGFLAAADEAGLDLRAVVERIVAAAGAVPAVPAARVAG